eukprot:2823762-Pyramimonas_sp.AAC.1
MAMPWGKCQATGESRSLPPETFWRSFCRGAGASRRALEGTTTGELLFVYWPSENIWILAGASPWPTGGRLP